MTLSLFLSFLVAFAASVAAGLIVVPILRKLKAGQSIKENGPVWHMSKQGTPTMGGIIFITGIVLSVFTVGMPEILAGNYTNIFVLVFALIFGAIGFFDDYQKLKKKNNTGLSAGQKFILQVIAAIAFVLLLRFTGHLTPALYVPFIGVTIKLNIVVYFAFSAFVIVGCVNSVNLTDGVDGLATGVSIPVALCYTAVAAAWGYKSQGIFAAALAGALVGFLIFNFHPAKVFMGDTGSLFLGGAVCAMAFAMDMPLILIPLGIVYIIETLSDVLQVAYFKATHGKRIFKMAPIHHHFEMCGWNEYKVFAVFSGVSAVFAVISYFGVFKRF
jgi:phospho-N-acetylmuramoyl-pentapeptide-transferase